MAEGCVPCPGARSLTRSTDRVSRRRNWAAGRRSGRRVAGRPAGGAAPPREFQPRRHGRGGAGRGARPGCGFSLSLPCGVRSCLPTDVTQPLKNSCFLAGPNGSSHSQRLGAGLRARDATPVSSAGRARSLAASRAPRHGAALSLGAAVPPPPFLRFTPPERFQAAGKLGACHCGFAKQKTKSKIQRLRYRGGFPCDQMKNRLKTQFLPWHRKQKKELSLPSPGAGVSSA